MINWEAVGWSSLVALGMTFLLFVVIRIRRWIMDGMGGGGP